VEKVDNILTEARARIIWGESCESVLDFLTTNGFSADDARAHVGRFHAERTAEVRKIALRNVLVGGGLSGAMVLMFFLVFKHPDNLGTHVAGHIAGKGIAVFVVGGVYGFWKLIDGLIDLIRPQSESKSIPDMSDF
jgi:hypothetical protein